MTGPEHYREAERLLEASSGPNASAEWIAACQGAAQVHATLALTAAVANTAHHEGGLPLASEPDSWATKQPTTWAEVLRP